MLIDPALAPVTFAIGFLARPLDAVAHALGRWYEETDQARVLRPEHGGLPEAVAKLEPLSAPLFRRAWIETSSPRWPTAYLDGFINGTDAFPPVSYLAQRLGCEGITLGLAPQSALSYGNVAISLYGARDTEWLNLEWGVQALNDGGRWTWRRMGAAQPFEEDAAYAERRVRDRLTPERLLRYAAALEVPLAPGDFGPRFVLDSPKREPVGQRRETLREARIRYGLEQPAAARG